MKYTEEHLIKYNIKSIQVISEITFPLFINIIHNDGKKYNYNLYNRNIKSMEYIIDKHIGNFCIKPLRKRKLNKINKKYEN